MLTPRTRAILAAYAVVGLVQVVADGMDAGTLARAAQVLLMPLLALVLLAQVPGRPRLVRLTLVALLFSWLGDSAPGLLGGDAAFLAMVGLFLVAQVCYILAFRPYAADGVLGRHRRWLPVYVVAVVALVAACLPGADAMLPAVLVYGLCLGTMAVLSTGVDRLAWAGGALFLVSDGLIALDAFATGLPGAAQDVAVMATYVVAQLLLVLGVVARVTRPAAPADRPGSPASSARGSSAAPAGRGTTPAPATPAP